MCNQYNISQTKNKGDNAIENMEEFPDLGRHGSLLASKSIILTDAGAVQQSEIGTILQIIEGVNAEWKISSILVLKTISPLLMTEIIRFKTNDDLTTFGKNLKSFLATSLQKIHQNLLRSSI